MCPMVIADAPPAKNIPTTRRRYQAAKPPRTSKTPSTQFARPPLTNAPIISGKPTSVVGKAQRYSRNRGNRIGLISVRAKD